jgi:hypothetical protein
MSQVRGQYSLFFSLPTDTLTGEFPFTQETNSFVDALATAWLARAAGEDIRGIGYKRESPTGGRPKPQSILEGKTFQEVLDLITQRGAQPGVLPTEIVQQLAPEILAERLARLEEIITERSGEAAVYRNLLEDLYKAADEAIKKRNLELLHTITGKLAFWYVPSESDVKQWGKDFLHAYRRDYGWLQFTKKVLEKIKASAVLIEAPEGSRNAALKQEIIKLVDEGLIPHM